MTLLEWHRVPRFSAISLALLAHLVAFSLLLLSPRTEKVRIRPQKYDVVAVAPQAGHLVFAPKASPNPRLAAGRRLAARSRPPAHIPPSASAGKPDASKTLYEQARRSTKAIITSYRFRAIYGFSPTDYQFAARSFGEVPHISADEVPPRFEQYVTVEVTIDTEGKVAEARIVGGLVAPEIEQKLLSAIRGFKYNPARRDGIPIPSQVDIVIHIPT